jgi:sn-glycerol 3-phosphate transport system substrate-binding protein
MLNRKAMIFAAVFVSLGTLLFAGASRQGGSAGGKTALQFWHSHSGGTGEALENCVKVFNASQDKIEVVPTYQGGYYDAMPKLLNAIAGGGDLPDFFQMGTGQVSAFSAEKGILADLLPLMKKTGMDPNDFLEPFIWDYYVNGQLIAVPFGRSTPVLYVNRDMLDKAGLKIPTTWDELMQVATALTRKEGNEYVTQGFGFPRDTWYLNQFLGQAGGKLLNNAQTAMGCIDDGTALAAWTFMQEGVKSGAFYYPPTGVDIQALFLSEKLGMFMNSVGGMGGIFREAKFKVEAAWVPKGKKQLVVTGGNSLCLLESSKNKDQSWQFMDWLYRDPNGLVNYIVYTGYFPPNKSMVNLPAIQQAWTENPYRRLAYEQLQYGDDKFWMYPQTAMLQQEEFVLMDAILYDLKDVRQQIDLMNTSFQSILRK